MDRCDAIFSQRLSEECEGGAAEGCLYTPPPPVRTFGRHTRQALNYKVQGWVGGKAVSAKNVMLKPKWRYGKIRMSG